jgi:hypothetical protein
MNAKRSGTLKNLRERRTAVLTTPSDPDATAADEIGGAASFMAHE